MFKIVSGAAIVALSMTTAAQVQAQVQAQAQSVAAQPVQATVAPAATPAATATPAALNATRVEAPVAGAAVLPSNTEVLLRLDQEVSSKVMKVGDSFKLTVLQDVMLGNYVVIPRGTPASGTITYRTGKGAFGKSAKMEITMNAINLNGRSIPLTGNFRQEGEGNTGATIGMAVAVGVFSAFVTGRSAIFQRDREFRVATREAIPVTLPN
jgi:glucose/arabinose dehydrogenase